ncbi:MAG: nitric oxide reductase transcriptional regulator NorR, partial [Planctomycetes bacterium]|nr:nitric oxide reductase transcriptional regulator NorR [Planctomycetota bacterium]
MKNHHALLEIAFDLTSSLPSQDRYQKLLDVVQRMFNCQCSCLLRLEGDILRPLAFNGLVPEVRLKKWQLRQHPRLDHLIHSKAPHIFPSDCDLPDPFDGLLSADSSANLSVHSCMGSPLIIEGEVIGLLTADSLKKDAFKHIDLQELKYLSSLAGAMLRTSELIDQLEALNSHQRNVMESLIAQESEKQAKMIGSSAEMVNLHEEIKMVAQVDAPLLITGETGVGKELVARQVHGSSKRSYNPLIYVNCAALPESVAESELFGHTKGAFTGADKHRAGKFEVADGGSLFLDEIGELPLSLQAKLLRAIQEGEVQRVGSDEYKKVDVRIITATNRQLAKEVQENQFRADLYHRINAFTIDIPNLKERISDIPLLAGYFLNKICHHLNLQEIRLDSSAREILMSYSWPGNIRELENLLFRSAARAQAKRSGEKELILTVNDFESLLNDKTSVSNTPSKDENLKAQCSSLIHQEQNINLRDATDA